MARVDFYILAADSGDDVHGFACRLTDKAWQQGYRVFLRTGDGHATADLDKRLWTFREDSFIPHAALAEADDEPVQIGTGPAPTNTGLLINLADDQPEDWARFARVAELASAQPDARAQARERYQAYRSAGVTPQTHNLAGST